VRPTPVDGRRGDAIRLSRRARAVDDSEQFFDRCDSVEAIPNRDMIEPWLDVYVARIALSRRAREEVHDVNDRDGAT